MAADPGEGRAWSCERYGGCLEEAARLSLPDFPCPCERFKRGPGASLRELDGCLLLLLAVFFPDRFGELMAELRFQSTV